MNNPLFNLPDGVTIFAMSLTLQQEADSCGDGLPQCLEIKTDNAGGGPYAILETERWALDESDGDKLATIIKQCVALCIHEEHNHDTSNDA